MKEKGAARRREYEKRGAPSDVATKQWMEQQAAALEKALMGSDGLALFGYMSERGLERMGGMIDEELARRRGLVKEETPDRELTVEEKKALEGVKVNWDKKKP